jgi:hypothetical protein
MAEPDQTTSSSTPVAEILESLRQAEADLAAVLKQEHDLQR